MPLYFKGGPTGGRFTRIKQFFFFQSLVFLPKKQIRHSRKHQSRSLPQSRSCWSEGSLRPGCRRGRSRRPAARRRPRHRAPCPGPCRPAGRRPGSRSWGIPGPRRPRLLPSAGTRPARPGRRCCCRVWGSRTRGEEAPRTRCGGAAARSLQEAEQRYRPSKASLGLSQHIWFTSGLRTHSLLQLHYSFIHFNQQVKAPSLFHCSLILHLLFYCLVLMHLSLYLFTFIFTCLLVMHGTLCQLWLFLKLGLLVHFIFHFWDMTVWSIIKGGKQDKDYYVFVLLILNCL